MKKRLLIIGATGSIGTYFLKENADLYEIISTSRNPESELYLDLLQSESINKIELSRFEFDHVIFLSGINPRSNLKEITEAEFIEIFTINIISPAMLIKRIHHLIKPGGGVLFVSSIATEKGSYDPSYAASKSALSGLIKSLTREFNYIRFNILSLGLVQNSKVHLQMTDNFIERHKSNMHQNKLIELFQVNEAIKFIIENDNVSNSNIPLTNSII